MAARQRWVAWFAGLVLGIATGMALLVAGLIGIAVLVVGIVLLATYGPRMHSIAGFLTGFGLVWTILFVNVKMTCATLGALPGETCRSGNTDLWLIASFVILAVGLLVTFGVWRPGRSGSTPPARR